MSETIEDRDKEIERLTLDLSACRQELLEARIQIEKAPFCLAHNHSARNYKSPEPEVTGVIGCVICDLAFYKSDAANMRLRAEQAILDLRTANDSIAKLQHDNRVWQERVNELQRERDELRDTRNSVRVDKFIETINSEHRLAGVNDFEHYFQMSGLLANKARGLEIELRGVEAALNEERNVHAELQARCYEGYPSVSDGIFDYLKYAEAQLTELQAKYVMAARALFAIADDEGPSTLMECDEIARRAIAAMPQSVLNLLAVLEAVSRLSSAHALLSPVNRQDVLDAIGAYRTWTGEGE